MGYKKIILIVLNEINLFSNYYKDIYKKGLNPNYFEIINPYKISFLFLNI